MREEIFEKMEHAKKHTIVANPVYNGLKVILILYTYDHQFSPN